MKSLKDLGKALNKAEQKMINGGGPTLCCDPAISCCTTSHAAQNVPRCGGIYKPGCQYHFATDCCV